MDRKTADWEAHCITLYYALRFPLFAVNVTYKLKSKKLKHE